MTQRPEVLLSQKLGLKFNDLGVMQTALTHRSAGARNNERLEYLGDSILGFVIAEYLYQRFPDADEGVLSRLRSSLVNQDSLAELARGFGLGEYLIMGSGELKSGGHRRDSILSDALEALIGALYNDQGISVSRAWILDLFSDRLENLSPSARQKDPKTRLQEFMQAKGLELPEYTLVSTDGLPHQQFFRVHCKVSVLRAPKSGVGSSRKKAEQQAAREVLDELNQ